MRLAAQDGTGFWHFVQENNRADVLFNQHPSCVSLPKSQFINSYSIRSKHVAQYSPLSKHSGWESRRG